MSLIFFANIYHHTRSAKNKGIINGGSNYPGDSGKGITFVVHAKNKDDAYSKLAKAFEPSDKRPLSGKSYLRALKVGQQVYIPRGYQIGYGDDGSGVKRHFATVVEVLTNSISVEFKNYPNQVDFGFSELAQFRILPDGDIVNNTQYCVNRSAIYQ